MPADQSDPLREQLQASLGSAYTLERELGGGGMARVFVAREEALARSVVVKVLPPELAEGLSAERFAREIRLAAQLQEPHIVPVLSAGATLGGLPYYTMPFVRGESLRARLRSGPILLDDALGMLRDVAMALAYAHKHGIVHRDIKPENVLLSGGTAVVTDFGIAKAVGAARTPEVDRTEAITLTQVGSSLGTPAYMAPEQSSGDLVDARADIYAWGVVAYEMLAGKHPFAGKTTAQQLIVAHLSEQPAPLSTTRADLPPALATLVMRCLAKDPARRPQIAEEIVASLKGVDTTARAPRLAKFAAGAAILVLVAFGGTLLARTRTRESPEAQTAARNDAPTSAYASSIAVLPLTNYSRDSAQDFFADGMTDELTTTLSKLQALHVIAHRSMLRYKRSERTVPDIARELGVKYVVDGSVRQDGDRVRISAKLVNAETNTHVWAESFDRERRDVLALQREVALAIAERIQGKLTPQDRLRLRDARQVDPVAFDLYLKGTQARYSAFRPADAREVIRYFERAVARDPAFASAHAGLGLMQVAVGDTAGARRSAEKARALEPSLAEGAMLLGMIRQNVDKDWAGAEAAMREAIRLKPGFAEAHHELSMLLMRLGQFDEAVREGKLAVYQAPATPRFEIGVGEVLVHAERYDDVLAAVERTLALDSTYGVAHGIRSYVYSLQGDVEKTRAALAKCDPRVCADFEHALLGHAYALRGDRAEALRRIDTLEARWKARGAESGAATGIAQVYAALGERERALHWLEKGLEAGEFMLYTGIDPALKSLRKEPRFRELLRKLKLPAS